MKVKINRAPVLTLWAAVVAQRLGYTEAESLTFGKALAGLNAQSKGRRLGIYAPRPKPESARGTKPSAAEGSVELMGRSIPVVRTPRGLRAADKGEALDPDSVRRYLGSKFGEALPEVRQAMTDLARSYSREDLTGRAFALYEAFRPAVPKGEKGWGVAGELDLARLERLHRTKVGS